MTKQRRGTPTASASRRNAGQARPAPSCAAVAGSARLWVALLGSALAACTASESPEPGRASGTEPPAPAVAGEAPEGSEAAEGSELSAAEEAAACETLARALTRGGRPEPEVAYSADHVRTRMAGVSGTAREALVREIAAWGPQAADLTDTLQPLLDGAEWSFRREVLQTISVIDPERFVTLAEGMLSASAEDPRELVAVAEAMALAGPDVAVRLLPWLGEGDPRTREMVLSGFTRVLDQPLALRAVAEARARCPEAAWDVCLEAVEITARLDSAFAGTLVQDPWPWRGVGLLTASEAAGGSVARWSEEAAMEDTPLGAVWWTLLHLHERIGAEHAAPALLRVMRATSGVGVAERQAALDWAIDARVVGPEVDSVADATAWSGVALRADDLLFWAWQRGDGTLSEAHWRGLEPALTSSEAWTGGRRDERRLARVLCALAGDACPATLGTLGTLDDDAALLLALGSGSAEALATHVEALGADRARVVAAWAMGRPEALGLDGEADRLRHALDGAGVSLSAVEWLRVAAWTGAGWDAVGEYATPEALASVSAGTVSAFGTDAMERRRLARFGDTEATLEALLRPASPRMVERARDRRELALGIVERGGLSAAEVLQRMDAERAAQGPPGLIALDALAACEQGPNSLTP